MTPDFRLGFEALAGQIPAVVGQPLENERHNPENGDGLQQTTTGLMVWRKADNWTAFTDGVRTWVNGPYGVMERSNDQRFSWEGGPIVTVPTARPTPEPRPVEEIPLPSASTSNDPDVMGEWVTSKHYSEPYYFHWSDPAWKIILPSFREWFDLEVRLQQVYPGRNRHPIPASG